VNKDAERLTIIQALMNGTLDTRSAARILDLTERQVYRLKARAKSKGIKHVLHKGKGRTPSNKISVEVWETILRLVQGQYRRLNDYELQEALARNHNIYISRESLRKKLRAAGIPPKLKRDNTNTQFTELRIH
jgi:transposase